MRNILIWVLTAISLSCYAGNASNPHILVDSSGNMYAVWLYSTNGDANYLVQAGIAPSGGSWTTTTLSCTVGSNANPTIAINATGDAVVLWTGMNSATGLDAAYAAIRPEGGTWSSATSLNTSGSALPSNNVTINASGEIAAIWSAYTDTSQAGISAYSSSTTISSGIWSSISQLSN